MFAGISFFLKKIDCFFSNFFFSFRNIAQISDYTQFWC